MADDVVDIGNRHFRGEDVSHGVEVAEEEEARAEFLVIDGRVGAKIEKMRVFENFA